MDNTEVESHRRLSPRHHYEKESVCLFPPERSLPAEYIRRLADELTHGGPDVRADKSYETVRARREGEGGGARSVTGGS